jgi:hypothetical protein
MANKPPPGAVRHTRPKEVVNDANEGITNQTPRSLLRVSVEKKPRRSTHGPVGQRFPHGLRIPVSSGKPDSHLVHYAV